MKIGYARPAKDDPDGSCQQEMLQEAGCQRVFVDQAQDTRQEHPGLETILSYLQAGDTLVVWRLERLGRSFKHLVKTVNHLAERSIGFQSLQESIDTTAAHGPQIFQTFAALAEFQRNINRERTKAGLAAARARGRNGGRPKALDAGATERLYRLYDERVYSIRELCQIMGISKTTLYNYLKERKTA